MSAIAECAVFYASLMSDTAKQREMFDGADSSRVWAREPPLHAEPIVMDVPPPPTTPPPPQDDMFTRFKQMLEERNRFIQRLERLRRLTDECLIKDGEPAALHDIEQQLRTPGTVFASLALRIGAWPPPAVEQEYCALVTLAGTRYHGCWTILHMDLLTAFEKKPHLLSDIFPSTIASHPNVSFAEQLSDDAMVEYKNFFAEAARHLRGRIDQTDPTLVTASGAVIVRVLGLAYSVLTTLEWIADKILQIMQLREDEKRRQAAEAQRQAAEEIARNDRALREVKPVERPDVFLHQLERYREVRDTMA